VRRARGSYASRKLKDEVHRSLQDARQSLVTKLEGLDEYSLRRPMTATGTNLLGLVKHLGGQEYGYLGEAFGRPPDEDSPAGIEWIHESENWFAGNDEMWARADESSEYLLGFYRRACAHADETIGALELDSAGFVPWWEEGDRETTLGAILVRVQGETLRHAGQVDIIRELLDGRAGDG
jgi:uncharacterized damage-inducible protein DinB